MRPVDRENDSWTEPFNDYRARLVSRVKPSTHTYRVDGAAMLRDYCRKQRVPINKLTHRHIDYYVAARAERGNGDCTRRHAVTTAKLFTEFCFAEGFICADPLKDYKTPTAERPYVKMPTMEELQALLRVVVDQWDIEKNPGIKHYPPRTRKWYQRRNYAIVLATIGTGCRIGEILALKVEDFRPKERRIIVTQSKTKKPREVPISDELIVAIEDWLNIRKTDQPWLFTTTNINPVTKSNQMGVCSWDQQFARYCKKAGIKTSPHKIRHYAANRLAAQNVKGAQEILGHDSLATTIIYLHGDQQLVRSTADQANILGELMGTSKPELTAVKGSKWKRQV